MEKFVNMVNTSHLSLKSVKSQMDNSKKAISHQISDYAHVGYVLRANLSLNEVVVLINSSSPLSNYPNNSNGEVKDILQNTIQTQTGGHNSHINRSVQSYSPYEFMPSVTKPVTISPEKFGSTKTSTCTESPCFPGVSCVPTTDGHFKCGRCPFGYYGDGINCKGIVTILQKI
jgi:hypothetical protein